MRKFFCVIMTLLLSLSIFCACRYYESDTYSSEQPPRTDEDTEPTQKEETPPPGEFYSLEEAYEKGWISKNDLMNIAYYKNGNKLFEEVENFTPSPKNPETLSEETENAIKETRAYDLRIGQFNFEAISGDVYIDEYLGTYNGYVVVMLSDKYTNFAAMESFDNIDGVTIYYSDSQGISLWKYI